MKKKCPCCGEELEVIVESMYRGRYVRVIAGYRVQLIKPEIKEGPP